MQAQPTETELPKLVMTAVLRDEADILPDWLRYHRAQGIAHFLILDHRSIDATPELLAEAEQTGWLTWFRESSLSRDQGRWITTLARMAYDQHGADWVINNDGDEFWFPRQGTLQTSLAAIPQSHRLLRAPRHNFAARLDYEAPFWRSLIYRFAASRNFIGRPLSPKLCHRGESAIIVHHGNHSVEPMSAADIWPETPIEVFHFPARDYAQFERKIRNGGASWAANPAIPASIGEAKRQLYDHYLLGQLPAWFRDWAYSPAELEAALASGELLLDTRMREFMERIAKVE